MSDADNNRRTNNMRTIRTKVYKFNELSEDAKQNVIENNYYINVDFEWWESVYEDAEQIGLKLTEFDIDRASYCKGDFINSAMNTANLILANHGSSCETYKTASVFINECKEIEAKAKEQGKDGDEDYWFDDEIEELADEFKKSLLEDYRIMLTKEYEYLTSEEAIIETIVANEYEFTEDGKRF